MLQSEEIIQKRQEFLFPGVHHFYKSPPHIVSGSMQYLYDNKGKQYLDLFAGVSVMNCGHCNPEILKATITQMQELQHTTTIYLTEPIVQLAEKLAEILPGELRRSFFCNSGSEANEGALLLARVHTKRRNFIYLSGGLHGRTQLTASVTGIPMWRGAPYLEESFYKAPGYQDKNSLKTIEEVLALDSDIAAIILEPIQGNGGIISPPKGYMEELYRLADTYGFLIIMDEVQTGYGRTGAWFGCSHHKRAPHILTSAKALGNGYPIAAFSTTDEIAASMTIASASTLGGHPTAATTALAVIDYIEQHDLCLRSKEMGERCTKGLEKLVASSSLLQGVRGQGLMIGVEVADTTTAYGNLSGAEITDLILEEMKDRGVIIGKNGLDRNVLAIQPPLVITEKDVDFALDTLAAVLRKIEG